MLLDRRTALVTGAANGIGRAIAECFVREGARVAGLDREPTDANDDSIVRFACELVPEEANQLVASVEAAVGPLDVLVNCAGINLTRSVLEMSLEEWHEVLRVNLDAPVFLAAAAARGMLERGYGRIVNITSVHGERGARGTAAYDASKAALNNATRSLAAELSSGGVLVNAIAPGFVETRNLDPDAAWFRTVYLDNRKLPIGRQAQPPEVAAHVAWLASDRNTYVTGAVLVVDGGLTATF